MPVMERSLFRVAPQPEREGGADESQHASETAYDMTVDVLSTEGLTISEEADEDEARAARPWLFRMLRVCSPLVYSTSLALALVVLGVAVSLLVTYLALVLWFFGYFLAMAVLLGLEGSNGLYRVLNIAMLVLQFVSWAITFTSWFEQISFNVKRSINKCAKDSEEVSVAARSSTRIQYKKNRNMSITSGSVEVLVSADVLARSSEYMRRRFDIVRCVPVFKRTLLCTAGAMAVLTALCGAVLLYVPWLDIYPVYPSYVRSSSTNVYIVPFLCGAQSVMQSAFGLYDLLTVLHAAGLDGFKDADSRFVRYRAESIEFAETETFIQQTMRPDQVREVVAALEKKTDVYLLNMLSSFIEMAFSTALTSFLLVSGRRFDVFTICLSTYSLVAFFADVLVAVGFNYHVQAFEERVKLASDLKIEVLGYTVNSSFFTALVIPAALFVLKNFFNITLFGA